jgi:hypothetical protein
MYKIHEQHTTLAVITEEDRQEIRNQLNRLIETHHFKNSRRYPALLRFIVEETLDGRGEFLKERLIGVRLFDRPPNYDTASDPIVRVTIAEIRKRIAQYYHEEEHDAEMRIELLPGSYLPEFRPRALKRDTAAAHEESNGAGHPDGDPHAPLSTITAPPITAPATAPATAAATAAAPAVSKPRRRSLYLWWPATLAAALVLGVWLVPLFHWVHPTAIEQLWSPILSTSRSTLFCIPTDAGTVHGAAGGLGDPIASDAPIGLPASVDGNTAEPTFLDYEVLGQNVVYSDMLATLKITNYLVVSHHDYHVRPNVATTLEDLRQAPAVLIGGLDNQWTMRALAPLRYHFTGSDEDSYWIQDSHDPGNKRWSLNLKQNYSAVTRDYAIIARLHNQQTGQPELIVAGIGMSGTAAAGEFIGDERRVQELSQRIGPGFKTCDFEAILSTDVVNGIAGAPRILVTTSW